MGKGRQAREGRAVADELLEAKKEILKLRAELRRVLEEREISKSRGVL